MQQRVSDYLDALNNASPEKVEAVRQHTLNIKNRYREGYSNKTLTPEEMQKLEASYDMHLALNLYDEQHPKDTTFKNFNPQKTMEWAGKMASGVAGGVIDLAGNITAAIQKELGNKKEADDILSGAKYTKGRVEGAYQGDSTTNAGETIGHLLPLLNPVGEDLVSMLGMGAVTGAEMINPNGNVGEQLASSIIGAPIAGFSSKGLEKGINYFTKKNALIKLANGSYATPEEIQKGINSASGSPTLAGEILKNPEVKSMESNMLPALPFFSKQAIKKLAASGSELVSSAKNIIESLGGIKSKHDASEEILQDINKYDDDENKKISAMYKSAFSDADKEGVKVSQSGYKDAAKQLYEELKDESYVSGLPVEPKFMAEVDSISKNAPNEVTLQQAHRNRSKWGKALSQANKTGTPEEQRRAAILYAGASKDIESALNKERDSKSAKGYKEAQKYYKENYAPLEESGIAKYLTGKKDYDQLVNTFLPKDKSRVNLLEKISKVAPNSSNNLLSAFLSGSIKENMHGQPYVDPYALNALLNNLGPERLKILTKNNKNLADEIEKFKSKMGASSDSLRLMFNPTTGYANVPNINYYESTRAANDLLSDLINIKPLSFGTKIAGYSSKINKARAINDPEILNNILRIKLGLPIKGSFVNKAASGVGSSGIPLQRSLQSFLTSGDQND